MFDKIKTNAKEIGSKVKTGVKENKDKIIKGAAIVGGAAVACGIALLANSKKVEYVEDDSVDLYEYRDPETDEVVASLVIDSDYEKPEFEVEAKSEEDEGTAEEEK